MLREGSVGGPEECPAENKRRRQRAKDARGPTTVSPSHYFRDLRTRRTAAFDVEARAAPALRASMHAFNVVVARRFATCRGASN